jgi:uncharacterized protein
MSIIRRYPQATFWVTNWTTWTFAWFMGTKYPSDLWFFFLYIPFLSGVLITAIADGRSGLKAFFSRMFRWRVGIQWYAVALLLPPVLRLAAVGLGIVSGVGAPAAIQLPSWTDLLAFFLFPATRIHPPANRDFQMEQHCHPSF